MFRNTVKCVVTLVQALNGDELPSYELLQLLNSWFLRLLLNLYFFLGDNGCDILKSLILTKIH
jgi:hypothetical protein